MLIQIVQFNLKDMSDTDFRAACDGWAPVVAAMPGLHSKVWLADAEANTYGGIYTWEDAESMAAYTKTPFFKEFAASPSIVNITSHVFGVLDGPTRVTSDLMAIAA